MCLFVSCFCVFVVVCLFVRLSVRSVCVIVVVHIRVCVCVFGCLFLRLCAHAFLCVRGWLSVRTSCVSVW